jgi:hypothetical protein
MYAESYKMDSLLLKHIEGLKNLYIKEKRPFRNYDLNFLYIYIRQLGNYEVLSKETMEDTFNKGIEYFNKQNSS